MADDSETFELELTWLEEHPQAYDLGECEFHLAFEVDDYDAAHKLHEEREELYGEEAMREIERAILLKNVDLKWMDYIDAMDELKQSVGLLAYGQKDPVVAFRQMSYDMFDEMTSAIREDTVKQMLTVVIKSKEETTKAVVSSFPQSKKAHREPGMGEDRVQLSGSKTERT